MTAGWLAAALFGVIGAVGVVVTTITAARALESRSWPVVRGTVLVSRYDVATGVDGPMFRAFVEYEYGVAGWTWRGKRVAFGDALHHSFSGYARAASRRYRPGTQVIVYYDPADPGEAVLEPGVNRLLIGHFALSASFVGIAFAALRSA